MKLQLTVSFDHPVPLNCVQWYVMILHGILVFDSIHYYSMEFDGIAGYYIVFDNI